MEQQLETAAIDAVAAWTNRQMRSRQQPLRADAATQARYLLLDTLGCALAGADHPVVVSVAKVAAHSLGDGAVRGIASGRSLSLLGAVLENGTAIRILDQNDFYWGAGLGGHPSDMFGVALAVAELENASLGSLLSAVVAAYDLYVDLLDLMPPDGPFDHASANALGAAVIAGHLFGLDADRLAHAVAMAGVTAPSLLAVRYGGISEFKGVATAHKAVGGVLAAVLAREGVTGPCEQIDGPRGLDAILRGGKGLSDVLKGREHPRILDVTIKRYPCIGTAQAAVAAAAAIHRQVGGHLELLETISVRLPDNPVAWHQTTEVYRRPANRETADHSFFSLVAMALVDGDLTIGQFERRRYLDADVLALSDKLSFICDLDGAERGKFGAEITAESTGQDSLHFAIPFAPGHPQNPLNRAAVEAKFRSLGAKYLGDSALDALVAQVLDGTDELPVQTILQTLHLARKGEA